MSKKWSYVLIAVVVLVLAALVWGGVGWLWHKVLELHGIH
jgi:hypothetical protein